MADEENIDLQLNLDSSGFVRGADDAAHASAAMGTAFAAAQRSAGLLGKSLSLASPGRLIFGGATVAAASWQQQISSVAATAKVTGQSLNALQGGMQGLARAFPVGNKGALEVVSTLQQMGLTGKTQIATINSLGKAYIQLGAATGQSAAVIGRQMTMLDRAFGASDANTVRFRKMSDSLTTVTAKIGGNASDILAFSKNIAPLARNAGIGQTAVMGISAAFSKMGEDGYLASNAMNKMLGDLNRSVRDGSSEMGTYAGIVGKTRKEFEALFKADPAKALSELVNALGTGSGGAQRNLERIGLDSVRTSRVFQGLIQQGGIQGAVNTAVGAYGNGSTERASRAAMEGLNDQFIKLRSATEQVATALGRPFLGAVTKVVELAGAPVRGAAGVLNSSMVQHLIQGIVPATIAYLGMRAAGTLGLTTALVRQGLNNGLVRGFGEARREAFNGAAPGPMLTASRNGTLDNMGFYGRASQTAIGLGRGFGMAQARYRDDRNMARWQRLVDQGMPYEEAYQVATRPGPTIRQRATRAALAVSSPANILTTIGGVQRIYNNLLTENARMLRTDDPTLRRMQSAFRVQRAHDLPPGVMGPVGPATNTFGKLGENLKTVNAMGGSLSSRMAMMGTVLVKTGSDSLRGASAVRAASGIVVNSLQTTATGLRALGASARASGLTGAVGSGLKGLAGAFLNPVSLATMGGYALFSNISSGQRKAKEQQEEQANRSTTSILDAYRESMGLATDSTHSFAEQLKSATESLLRTVNTMDQATQITSADRNYAEQTKNRVVNRFGGDDKSVIAQARLINPNGLSPQEMQALKVDLLRQRPESNVSSIISALSQGGPNKPGANPYSDIFTGRIGSTNAVGIGSQIRRAFFNQEGTGGSHIPVNPIASLVTAIPGFGRHQVGTRGNQEEVSAAQQRAITAVVDSINNTYQKNSDRYQEGYARQERARSANQAFSAAAARGDVDLIARMSKELSRAMGGTSNETLVDAQEANRAGGFVQALRLKNKAFASTFGGVDLNPNNGSPGLTPQLTQSALGRALSGVRLFGDAFGNDEAHQFSGSRRAASAYMEHPEDTGNFRKTMDTIMTSGQRAGMGMVQVGDAALRAVKALGDATSDASRIASAIFERAVSDNEANAGFQGSRVTMRNRAGFARSLMNSADSTQEGQERYDRGRQMLQGVAADAQSRAVARLQQQFDYQKQTARAERDFQTQSKYAWADYHKSLVRADEDYTTQRTRAFRDFNISVSQGTEDFHRSVMRETRDFNKQMKRANEDAAKAMYDPYKRITVEAVSDLGALEQNIEEQNQQLKDQVQNLNALRKAGVSNQAIDQLGLNKSENAQQAQQILDEITTGASPAEINALIAERMKEAGLLASDSSNTERQRAIDDFKQTLKDQNQDFTISVRRNRASFNRSLSDMEADYNRALSRQDKDFHESLKRQRKALDVALADQAQDIADSSKEIMGNFRDLASAVQDAMAGKAVDFRGLMHDTLLGTITDAKNLAAQYPEFFGGKTNTSGAASYTTSGGPAATGGRSGNGSAVGNTAITSQIRDPHTGEMTTQSSYVSAGTGAVVSGGSGQASKGSSADFQPEEEFMASHPANPTFNRSIAKSMLSAFGWDAKQFQYLDQLWTRESGWNQYADNDKSSAYGIPQALPGDKMQTMGSDWRTNPATQIKWGLHYIKSRLGYGTPQKAWQHEVDMGWYANGSIFSGPQMIGVGEKGPEAVIPLDTRGVSVIARAMSSYLSTHDAQRLVSNSHGDRITYNGGTFIEDHSTQINGAVTVQAQDPNAMFRAMQAKARAANLGATATKKR